MVVNSAVISSFWFNEGFSFISKVFLSTQRQEFRRSRVLALRGMFILIILFISIPECAAVRTAVVDDGSASTPRKQC
jgi:hypothetical protein